MRLNVGNVYVLVEHAEPEEQRWLEQYLSAEDSQFVEGRYGKESQYLRQQVSLVEGRLFPAGLLRVVRRAAAVEGVTVEVRDDRVRPCEPDLSLLPGWLRDYQVAAAAAALKAGRGILSVPMGGGKTEIFIGMTLALPAEWLFLVNSIDIVSGTIERYRHWTGEQPGTFKAGEWRRGTSNVTIAGFQAFWKAWREGAPDARALALATTALNVDECHGMSADTLYKSSMALENAYWRIGQSGTAMHRGELENLRVIGTLGPIIYKVPMQELVEQGRVSKARVRMVGCHQQLPADKTPSTWRGFHTKMIVKSRQRNELLAELATKAAKPSMLFVERLEHGRLVLEAVRARGLRAEFVHGEASLGRRKEELRRLTDGELDVLVCNDIFRQGINAPDVRSTINGAGGKTAIGTLQRMGRALRQKTDGSLECEAWDIDDSGHRWLERHSRERREAYEHEGWDVKSVVSLGL